MAENLAGARGSAVSIVLIYAAFGILWIVLSDQLMASLVSDPDRLVRYGIAKGSAFIILTSVMLYALIRQHVARLQAAHRREVELRDAQQKSLQLLASIARTSDDTIFAKDAEGRYTLFNEAGCRQANKTIDQVLGKDDAAIFPPELAQRHIESDRLVMNENRNLTMEQSFQTDRGVKTHLVTKGPLRDADGTVIGVFGISRDITEIKEVEREQRESEVRFQALVEQSAAGIYIIQDGRFRYVNPYLARLAGYASPREMMTSGNLLDLVVPEQRDYMADKLRSRMSGEDQDEAHYDLVGRRRDGTRVDLELHGNTFVYRNRPAVIGLILDISRRKTIERELRQRNAELEQINRAMIGRELTMIEMKKDINRLSGLLGREPPYDLAFLDEVDDPFARHSA